MSKALRQRVYGLLGGGGVLAAAAPDGIAWTLPRQRVRRLGAWTRAGLKVRFFPDGPWDLSAEPFGIHRYVREIFVDGTPVRESEQYRDMVARLSDPSLKGSVWGCRTVADVDRYFDELHAMYEDMRRAGYRPHTELDGDPDDEVKVLVGRGGRLIKASGGNHRVSFAKLLGIERIPVLVVGVHKDHVRQASAPATRATAVAEVLSAAGLEACRADDIERLAGRLQAGDRVRTVAAQRRQGVPVLIGTSLDDLSFAAAHAGFLFGS